MFGLGKKNSELESFANLLVKAIREMFWERAELKFSAMPKLERKNIIEYEKRMRVDGMEKFNHNPTFISTVNFYASELDMKKNKTLGALITYVEQSYIVELLKMLKYPPADDENEDAMKDCCGTLCNIIAGRFKSEVVAAGYIELEMSHFSNFRNTSFRGIDFCFNEFDKYEISFEIKGAKRLVVEMTMGTVPHASNRT